MTKNEEYAATYSEYAMEQMRRYGIPASVTLAQGILESSNGQSELSVKGNAHFGIKCTDDWLKNNGSYLVYTDDRPDEKFCTYATVGDSYEHHSLFLKENVRYKSCFALAPDDYRGWCAGLERAGYASGNNYAKHLQQIIEKNGLAKYDRAVMKEAEEKGISIGAGTTPRKVKGQNMAAGEYALPLRREAFMLVTSAFGMRKDPMDGSRQQMHKGVDIQTRHEAVLATETGGKVTAVNENGQTPGGKSVRIEYSREDGSRYEVNYLHLDSIQVKVGETVRAGQQVAVTGNTGTRTTGEHLHIGVKQTAANGNVRDLDPAAYLAEIAERGNLRMEMLCNGENLMAKYTPGANKQDSGVVSAEERTEQPLSAENWMKKLLSSEDSGVGLGGDPIMAMITTLYAGLMTLAGQLDNKGQEAGREQQMQAATEACLSRKVDIGVFVPSAEKCHIQLAEGGKPLLEATVNGQKISHELTRGEVNTLTKTLGNEELKDADKQQRIASVVGRIVLAEQASVNYNQELERGQQRGEGVKMN